MPYKSKAVANYILEKLAGITPLKLQKLLYFAHGWHLAILDGPLVEDMFRAWDYGPVLEPIYFEFREFGNKPIKKRATTWVETDGKFEAVPHSHMTTHSKTVIDRVLGLYGKCNDIELSMMAHLKGSPWDITRKALESGIRSGDISNSIIKDYFKSFAINNKKPPENGGRGMAA